MNVISLLLPTFRPFIDLTVDGGKLQLLLLQLIAVTGVVVTVVVTPVKSGVMPFEYTTGRFQKTRGMHRDGAVSAKPHPPTHPPTH